MLNTILYVVCILVLVIVLLMILTTESSSESSSSSGGPSSSSSSTSNTDVSSSTTTTSSPSVDTKTLLTAEDMIYCLTKDNECTKMTYESCTVDNDSTYFYNTKDNCNTALDNMSGNLDKVWCFHDSSCNAYDKDEIGFGLKIDDVSCSPQYTSEQECKNGVM